MMRLRSFICGGWSLQGELGSEISIGTSLTACRDLTAMIEIGYDWDNEVLLHSKNDDDFEGVVK